MTNAERERRHITTCNLCPICGGYVESLLHVFRDCNRIQLLWRCIVFPNNFQFFNVDNWNRWLEMNINSKQFFQDQNWRVIFEFTLESIWRARNEFVFAGSTMPFNAILARAQGQMQASIIGKMIVSALDHLQRRPLTSQQSNWRHSPSVPVTINVDASVKNLGTKAGCGGIFRSSNNDFLLAFSAQLPSCSVVEAELLAMLKDFDSPPPIDDFGLAELRGLNNIIILMALGTITTRLGNRLLPALCSTSRLLHSHATSFGFKQVNEEEKARMVGDVFTSVAENYDTMNDLMSAGLHRLWKERLVSMLNPFPGMKHLDVAGGTGDVAFRILENINRVKQRGVQDVFEDALEAETQIYVCDINPNMLNVGKQRAAEKGMGEDGSLVWVEGNAENLSFQNDSMDGYTIAFGIRNVTHIEKVLSEAHRVLKHGGRFLCLELSHVGLPIFKELYDLYSFSVIPYMGELVAGDRQSYQYLVESIRRFPPQEKFASMIADAGFQKVEYENLVGGVVAIHSGVKI